MIIVVVAVGCPLVCRSSDDEPESKGAEYFKTEYPVTGLAHLVYLTIAAGKGVPSATLSFIIRWFPLHIA